MPQDWSKKMTKTMILPVISAVALLLKSIFHTDIGSDEQNAVADLVLTGVTLWGIYKNHKKDLSQ
jgi:hypothetical protein